ncbi:MAG TPA: hypothetical protein VJU87_07995 [Gemmatimonadaceae bacterium]|nr:hypothetical protein [Gemmatimonadaceae bacterium]
MLTRGITTAATAPARSLAPPLSRTGGSDAGRNGLVWLDVNRQIRILCAAAIGALPLASCGDATTAITPKTLDGTWNWVTSVPGNGEQWKLQLEGTHVTGTGTWEGEACCAGSVSVDGETSGDSLHVDVTRTVLSGGGVGNSITYHFDGVLRTRTLLDGERTQVNELSSPMQLRRAE